MQQDSAVFVGLDTSKMKISVALARGRWDAGWWELGGRPQAAEDGSRVGTRSAACIRLSNDLVAVDRAHGGVAVTMKHDRGHRAPRVAERCACRGPALPHGGERGGEVLGDTTGQARMHV